MGKAKKRSIARGKHDQFTNLTRGEAIVMALEKISNNEDADNIITLFGLKAEELLEAGADFEVVKSLRGIL